MEVSNRWFWSVIASLLISYAHGQWNIRITGGAGPSRMNTDLYPATSRGEFQVVDRGLSWLIAGSVTHTITGPLSFSTGVSWSYITGHDEYWIQDVKVQETDRRIHYVGLPMMVNMEFGRFRFGAGYQLAIPIVGSGTFRTYPYANGLGRYSETVTRELGLEPFDIGVLGQLACRISERMDFGIRYYHGLLDVKDHSDFMISPLYNEQLVLTIGYRILPKRKEKPAGTPVQEVVPAE